MKKRFMRVISDYEDFKVMKGLASSKEVKRLKKEIEIKEKER